MRKKKEIGDLGIFNILLIGDSPHAGSIAANIQDKFNVESNDESVKNHCTFSICDDCSWERNTSSWFNEFIFDLTGLAALNNIVVSEEFGKWIDSTEAPMERAYMKKLLQAMNTIVVDLSVEGVEHMIGDIPYRRFNPDCDFLEDLFKWIDEQLGKLSEKLALIKLTRTMAGKTMPYLGDLFGCLSGKKSKNIVKSEYMKFDTPILFDEFCRLTRGMDLADIDESIFTRSNTALASFFK